MEYPYDEAEKLARKIRPLISFSSPMLFHGTRTPCTIAMQNVLRCPTNSAVCFTRLLHVAAYWATLRRRGDEEQYGAVLVFDCTKLAQRYRLECYRDPIWDEYPEREARKSSEAEECIVGRDVTNLKEYILDIIWIDGATVIARSPTGHTPLRPMPVPEDLMKWSHNRLLAGRTRYSKTTSPYSSRRTALSVKPIGQTQSASQKQ